MHYILRTFFYAVGLMLLWSCHALPAGKTVVQLLQSDIWWAFTFSLTLLLLAFDIGLNGGVFPFRRAATASALVCATKVDQASNRA